MPKNNTSNSTLDKWLSKKYREHKKAYYCTNWKRDNSDVECFAFTEDQNERVQHHFLFMRKGDNGVSFDAYSVLQYINPEADEDVKSPKEIGDSINVFGSPGSGEDLELHPTRLSASRTISMFGLDGRDPEIGLISTEGYYQSLGNQDYALKVDMESLMKKESKRFRGQGLSYFTNKLSDDTLNALRAVPDFSWSDYRFYDDRSPMGENRRQAAEVYPILATLYPKRPSLRMAVDRQRPLNDGLLQAFGKLEDGTTRLTKGHLRRIQGVSNCNHNLNPERILMSLAELPPDWVPSTDKDWDAFFILSETVGVILKQETGQSLSTLYRGCGGNWEDFLYRCARSYTDTRPPQGITDESFAYFKKAIDWKSLEKSDRNNIPDLINQIVDKLDIPSELYKEDVHDWLTRIYLPDCSKGAIYNASLDISDMVLHFSNQVVLPLAAKQSGELNVALSNVQIDMALTNAASILFSDKSVPAIFESGRQWHNRLTAINEAIASIGDTSELDEVVVEVADDGWPPLTDPMVAPNGLIIQPLTDPRDLKDEGRRLGHCVGGYTHSCRNQGHHILSIRDYDGQPLSTAEISPISRTNPEVNVRQHRGRRNSRPPEEALQAFNWYKRGLLSNTIPINFDGIKNYVSVESKGGDAVVNRCSYNWGKKKHILQAMSQWGQFVPKKYRKMTIGEFSEQPEIQTVSESILPTKTRSLFNVG